MLLSIVDQNGWSTENLSICDPSCWPTIWPKFCLVVISFTMLVERKSLGLNNTLILKIFLFFLVHRNDPKANGKPFQLHQWRWTYYKGSLFPNDVQIHRNDRDVYFRVAQKAIAGQLSAFVSSCLCDFNANHIDSHWTRWATRESIYFMKYFSIKRSAISPGGPPIMYGVVNGFVHIFMYIYYFLTILQPEKRKFYARFKPRITEIQLV